MACILFDKIVFGPVLSRRLGISLGINLLPVNKKICNFDCIYCECGWTFPGSSEFDGFHDFNDVKEAITTKFENMHRENKPLDNITFAGNGEPSLHPQFEKIVDTLIELRDKLYPGVNISVLTNGTTLSNPSVARALNKIEYPIIKLDTGDNDLLHLINRPLSNIKQEELLNNIKQAPIQNKIIQTLFLKGTHDGKKIDNTTDACIEKWLMHIKEIKPASVMIYSIARQTPAKGLEKISAEKLEDIRQKVIEAGIPAKAY